MDPLTAFGLGASIVQFVTFATSLINQTYKVYNSATGTTDRAQELEEQYSILLKFNSKLQNDPQVCLSNIAGSQTNDKDLESLARLRTACSENCQALLDIVRKLKVENGSGRLFQSFRTACRALRKEKRIEELESSLLSLQTQMTLHLCDIAHQYHEHHAFALAVLQRQAYTLEVDMSTRLDHVADMLGRIHTSVVEKDRNSPELSLSEIEDLQKQFGQLTVAERDLSRDLGVLQSLTFENYTDRYHAISEAHLETLGWIFEPQNTVGESLRLSTWLREGNGVFWISGKPGSGKSTLMKFIADHQQTQKELSIWAGSQTRVVTSSHYFWWTGTRLQKSQEGLLRMLLYGIFRKCPDLIQRVCGSDGEETISSAQQDPRGTRSWSFNKLRTIIQYLAKSPPLHTKFCFFIDGLDEYEGDHLDICLVLKDLAGLQNVKICVSSRPWNEFKLAFGDSDQKIFVHELTKNDIRGYTHSRLSTHPGWSITYGRSRSLQAKELTELIVQMAEGVFLWVFLVTQLLREGLSNSDSITDLYRRVQNFPPDLEQFFIQMLQSVDKFYHQKMATSLQLALMAKNPMNLSVYAFHEEEYDNPDYALEMPVKSFSAIEIQEQHEMIERRLNGWCKGLLEVHGREVHFLHRTVADFLRTGEMIEFLEKKSPANFDINVSMLRAYTAWIKSGTFPPRDYSDYSDNDLGVISRDMHPRLQEQIQKYHSYHVYDFAKPNFLSRFDDIDITTLTEEALLAATRIEKAVDRHHKSQQAMFSHLDAIDSAIQDLNGPDHVPAGKKPQITLMAFRTDVLQNALATYLDKAISREPTYVHGLWKSALSIVLDTFLPCEGTKPEDATLRSNLWPTQICATLRCLLANGHGPNAFDEDSGTPFKKLATRALSWKGDPWKAWTSSLIRQKVFSLFLDFGANPKSPLKRDGVIFSTPWFDFLMAAFHVPCETTEESVFLSEMDAFLQKDDIGMNVPITFPVSFGAAHGELLDLCPHEAFFFQMSHREVSGGSTHVRASSRLLGKVCMRLLRRMHDEGIEVKSAYRNIKKALPAAVCADIRKKHEAYVRDNLRMKKKEARKLQTLKRKTGHEWVAFGRNVSKSVKRTRRTKT